MAKEHIGTRIDGKLKKKAQEAAKKLGISYSQFIEDAVELYSGLDSYFIECSEDISDNLLKIDRSMVIQNIFLGWVAEKIALTEVFGDWENNLDEFTTTFEGMLTGEKLVKEIANNLKGEFAFLKTSLGKEREKYRNTSSSENKSPKQLKSRGLRTFYSLIHDFASQISLDGMDSYNNGTVDYNYLKSVSKLNKNIAPENTEDEPSD